MPVMQLLALIDMGLNLASHRFTRDWKQVVARTTAHLVLQRPPNPCAKPGTMSERASGICTMPKSPALQSTARKACGVRQVKRAAYAWKLVVRA